MPVRPRRNPLPSILLCGWALVLGMSGPAGAQVAKRGSDTLSSLELRSARLAPSQRIEPLEEHPGAAAAMKSWRDFRLAVPAEWSAWIDQRTGMIAYAEGGGLPWIPGHGNSLRSEDVSRFLKAGEKAINLGALEAIARESLVKVAGMMGVDPRELVLNRGRSGHPASHLWLIDFDLVRDGLVVEGARVVFRVNNGNLIQMGTENLPAPGTVVPPSRFTRDQALAAVAKYIGGFGTADTFSDRGSLHLVPVNIPSSRSAEDFDFGEGRGLARIWQFTFHRQGVLGTWQARVDAGTGEVLELTDVNRYGLALGGVYTSSPTTGSEVLRPMPFADIDGMDYSRSSGYFSFNSTPVSSTLYGKYVRINDTCGAITLSSDSFGYLNFGTSGGTDCATPGFGGPGNTHASREQFYQVNRAMESGRGWLPGNAWLNQPLSVNVNLGPDLNPNNICNAYWSGSTLNFYKSGGGCNNSGEIAGILFHEYGHGLDQNDGSGFSTDGGESYADVTSFIALHDSCIGPGFYQSQFCNSFGEACTTCTGVRDVDYAKRLANTPATVANFTQPRCQTGGGPCGREVHCESYVSSEAVWDFANRDLPGAGTGAAWRVLERLWYLSRSTATSAFTCHTGTTYTSDGCSAGSWWRTMRAVDDDDGNLANGTPHGGALFAAFDRHGIACASDPGAGVTFSGCSAPASPTLSTVASNSYVYLSWNSAGSGMTYDVFRNEIGCNAGFTKLASISSTSYGDIEVTNGIPYYYQVIAHPTGNAACSSPPSACVQITPPLLSPFVTATATSASQVSVTWSPRSGAMSYEIQRSYDNSPYQTIATVTSPAYTDAVPFADKTYVYHVRAVYPLGASAWSAPDIATTFFFTDDPLSPQVTPVKRVHLIELRHAVNLVRAAAGLPAATFTDPTPAGVKAVHLTELRSALDTARGTLGLQALWTAPLSVVAADDVFYLRDGTK
jgi:hypothetical protein